MKVFVKVISLILALLMLSSVFVSCNSTDTQKDNEVSDTVASTESETEAVESKTKLPEMNWEGKQYRILGRDATTPVFENFEIDRDEIPEDVVGLAVWNRNIALMNKYGIDVVGTFEKVPEDVAKVSLGSGDDLYDLVIVPARLIQQFATSGQFVNMSGLEYIDFENDAWNNYANEQLSFGGKLYYTTNKFLLEDKHRTWVVWSNRTLAKELKLGNFEEEVFNGTWTIDRYAEIAKNGSAETDGADGMTSADRWGVVLSETRHFAILIYSSGFRLTQKQSDGYPALVGATDQMMSIIDKVLALTADTQTCFVEELRPTSDENKENFAALIYREGRAVTMLHAVSWLSNLYRLNFEYGVLPTPKYSEDQESYLCFPDSYNTTLFAIPATVNDLKFAAFALEAISEESVETSYKEYIETKCKLQVAFDEDMAKCLNIVFNNIVYDVAYLEDYGTLKSKVVDVLITESSNMYGRLYSKVEKKAKHEIATLADTYRALPY